MVTLLEVFTVFTVFVAVGFAETVTVLLGAALAVKGDDEFCVTVVIALELALGSALP